MILNQKVTVLEISHEDIEEVWPAHSLIGGIKLI